MANILIIDDDMGICITLAQMTERVGQEGSYALTLKDL